MKLLFLALAFLCILHALRDYLQYKGVKNWLTYKVKWFWHNPRYEIHSMIFLLLLALLFLYLGFR